MTHRGRGRKAYLIVSIGFSANASLWAAARSVVTPTLASLPIRTIATHVACIATHTTDDASSEVLLLRTVVLAMTNLATILASLVLIITQSSVESSKLTKLITLELVLAFGN